MKLRYRPGGLHPRTPCLGPVIDFKWPERSPPPSKKILATPLVAVWLMSEFIIFTTYMGIQLIDKFVGKFGGSQGIVNEALLGL